MRNWGKVPKDRPPAPPAPPRRRQPLVEVECGSGDIFKGPGWGGCEPAIKKGGPVWRIEPPEEPGLYWFTLRTNQGERYPPGGVVRHCRVVRFEGRLILHSGQGQVSQRQAVDQFQRWWAGPLLEPVDG